MMGKSHAALGLTVGLGVAEMVGMRPVVTLAFGALVAGASLLPDLDETHSAVSHTVEPISTGMSWLVARMSGGHRRASHSLVAGAVVVGIVEVCSLIEIAHHVSLLAGVMSFVLASLLRVLVGHRLGIVEIVAAFGVGVAIDYFLAPTGALWPVVAIGMGFVLHLAEDWVTTGGVPWLWPWRHRFELALIGHTDSRREHVVRIGAIVVSLGLIALPVLQFWQLHR
jgi:membrane-bound metal-dependent hydrolase YbcI (DUF457 family)